MASNLARFSPRAGLGRFNPMRDLASAFDVFDIMRPDRLLDENAVRLDVTETEQSYVVKAEMPGIKKENIKVSVQGDQVTISGESDTEQDRSEGNFVYRERYHGSQFRSFTLPQSVDEENATANCHDGVLELVLPKRGGSGARQLTVQ